MGWTSGFRAIDDLPRAHWDEIEFRKEPKHWVVSDFKIHMDSHSIRAEECRPVCRLLKRGGANLRVLTTGLWILRKFRLWGQNLHSFWWKLHDFEIICPARGGCVHTPAPPTPTAYRPGMTLCLKLPLLLCVKIKGSETNKNFQMCRHV